MSDLTERLREIASRLIMDDRLDVLEAADELHRMERLYEIEVVNHRDALLAHDWAMERLTVLEQENADLKNDLLASDKAVAHWMKRYEEKNT